MWPVATDLDSATLVPSRRHFYWLKLQILLNKRGPRNTHRVFGFGHIFEAVNSWPLG